jgi:hypothetical protein
VETAVTLLQDCEVTRMLAPGTSPLVYLQYTRLHYQAA